MTKSPLALVTGAAGGLGQATAEGLLQAGCDVLLTDRDIAVGRAASIKLADKYRQSEVTFLELDLADFANIRQFSEAFLARFDRLDILINNAGLFPPFERAQTAQGCELGFGVGFYGHFALAASLWPAMLASPAARVVTVSSIAHSAGRIDCNDPLLRQDYDANRAYSACKLACLIFARELDRRAREHGLPLQSLAAHPGIARTQIGQYKNNPARSMRQHAIAWATRFAMGFLGQDAEQGALPMIHAALSSEVEGGQFIGPNGFGQFKGQPTVVQPKTAALKRCDADRIWQMAEQISQFQFSWTTQ